MTDGLLKTANSIQGLSRTTGLDIGTLDRAGRFISNVMKKDIAETLDILYEISRFRRWDRQINLIEKIETLLDKKKNSNHIRPIKSKMAIPIFKSAALEDQEELHDIWARLFAAALDPDIVSPRYVFIDIIRQLEIIDLKTLNTCYEAFLLKKEERRTKERKRIMEMYRTDHGIEDSNRAKAAARVFMETDSRIAEEPPLNYPCCPAKILKSILKSGKIKENVYQASMDNLIRQNLIIRCTPQQHPLKKNDSRLNKTNKTGLNKINPRISDHFTICLTALGLSFIETCLP